ncbi:MAG: aldo/keto reductase [Eubacteriales bacterium]|jgi:methylglyoxal reductase
MKMREIGKSGIVASAMGIGTWAAGGDDFWGKQDDSIPIQAIRAAIDGGITLVDTAPAYGFGHSEEVVGKALEGIRDKVVLSTKCGLWWEDDEGGIHTQRDGRTVYRNLSPRAMRIELENSLRRLKTDYIDIYITHWQCIEPFMVPIEETMNQLLEFKKEGKIRAIGVSNVEPWHVKEYLKYGQVDLIQEKYSMLSRRVEKELLPICEKEKITMQAYSPLEQGLLTGRFRMDYQVGDLEYRKKIEWYQPEKRAKVVAMLDGWQDLCDKYDCKLSNLVIAWTMAQSEQMNVLCGARKIHHVEENLKSAALQLDAADVARMRADAEKATR